jgi:acyl-CoA synthetase (AMP-forming)/AMP-acid ligase II
MSGSIDTVLGDPPEFWSDSTQWPSIPVLLREAVARFGDRLAAIDALGRLRFADLNQRSLAVARALVARGVQPGDRVVVWMENRVEWPVIALGIWRAGAIVVPLNTRLKGIEAAAAVRDSGATALFVVAKFLGSDYLAMLRGECGEPVNGRAFAELETLLTVVVLGETNLLQGCIGLEAFLASADVVGPDEVARREDAIAPDDVCEILFTSGTTGAPKGVVLGHQQVMRMYYDWSGLARLRATDRFLLVSPYPHGGPGINGNLVTSLMRGFATVMMDVFEPLGALDLMRHEGATTMMGPPNLYLQLMASASGRPPLHLRVAFLGMAAIPVELIEQLRDQWEVEHLCNAYGATDAGMIAMTRVEDPRDVVTHSSGRAFPDVEVRLFNDDGDEVDDGTPGEVWVRSYAVAKGYWHVSGQIVPVTDADGWYHSGDIGVFDKQGNLQVRGRKQGFFIVNGFNVYPAEVEGLLLRHGSISHAAIIPVADSALGELAVAFVVLKPGTHATPESIAQWARESMANYKAPKHVVVLERLPVNLNGKPDRAALEAIWREQVAAGTGG